MEGVELHQKNRSPMRDPFCAHNISGFSKDRMDSTCPDTDCGSTVSTKNKRPAGQPWPTIIISLVGAGLLMYTAIGPNIPSDRRIFGVVMILLWTLLWAVLLWVLWSAGHEIASWWLLIVGIGVIVLFFVIVIALNLGQ